MSCQKRKMDHEQDPDYEENRTYESKRLRLLEENAKAGFAQKVSAIVCREFGEELVNKEKEVKEIQERIYAARKTLHLLRYVVISSYYGRKQNQAVENYDVPKRIHPAVKKLMGKHPMQQVPSQQKNSSLIEKSHTLVPENSTSTEKISETTKKIPRYIPPKSSSSNPCKTEVNEPRGVQHKVKKRLVIGNISRWIPLDMRDDDASHKWMMYVRGPKEAPDISGFVSKVRFFLHPSYRPHDVVEISTAPFHLARRGWGEFPVRVQIHFTHLLNKPVDIIHQLKLDQTRTGLQTLGAETEVDIWLHRFPVTSATTVVNEVKECGVENEMKSELCDIGGRTGEESDCSGITLYEDDHHKTIVHDKEIFSVCEVKKEVNEIGTLVKGESNILNALNGDVLTKSFAEQQNDKIGHGSFDHDYTSTSNIKVIDHVNKDELGNEITVLSDTKDDHGSCTTVPEVNSDFYSGKANSVPVSEAVQANGSTGTCKKSVHILMCPSGNNERVVPSRDIKTEISELVSKKTVCQSDDQIVTCSELVTNKNVITPQVVSLPAYNEGTNVPLKPVITNNILSKTATLVKCVDRSGNVFYVTVGGMAKKSDQLSVKTSCNKSGSLILSRPGAPDTKLNSPVSLLSNSVHSKGLQQQKNGNLGKVVNVAPVSVPLVGSLPLTASQFLQKALPPKSNTGDVTTGSAGVIAHVKNALTNSGNVSATQWLKTGNGCLVADCGDGNQPRTSLLLTKPKVGNAHVLGDHRAAPCNMLSKVQSVTSPSKLKQNNLVSGQTLLLVKDGQIFLLKQCVSSKLDVSEKSKLLPDVSSTLQCSSSNYVLGSSPPVAASISSPLLLQSLGANNNSSLMKIGGSTRPGISVLKKNAVIGGAKKEENRLPFSGRTLVLNKANSRIVVNSRKPKYEEVLKDAVQEASTFGDIQKSTSWLLQHFPLVSSLAYEPDFRLVHPYAAASETTFLQWNHGKRKAAEWQRAKAVQKALIEIGFSQEQLWSTYDIVLWAKLHGYTPLPDINYPVQGNNPPLSEEYINNLPGTYTEPVKIMEWLETNLGNRRGSLEDDSEIDIINIGSPVKLKEEPLSPTNVTVMELSSLDLPECMYVRETARELGIKIPPEQIVPGILYCAAERLLVQAMRSFVEDLLRRSLRKAWERNSNRQPDTITIYDMRNAILDRPEFDLFTNIGLGVQAADTG